MHACCHVMSCLVIKSIPLLRPHLAISLHSLDVLVALEGVDLVVVKGDADFLVSMLSWSFDRGTHTRSP